MSTHAKGQVKAGTGRWATIVKTTDIVSNIAIMEGDVEPEIRNNSKDRFDLVEVDDGVQIGMMRSGKGFDWPSGKENKEATTYGGGVTRITDAVGDTTGEKSRGTTLPKQVAKPEESLAQPESVKPTPSKEPAKPEPGAKAAPAKSEPNDPNATSREPAKQAFRA